MAKQYWLVKTEPETYSYEDLERDGRTAWEGVRNYQARNNLRAMKTGDELLVYHSVGPKDVVGVASVVRTAYQDPSSDDDRWSAVDIKPLRRLARPVTLDQIKQDSGLKAMSLVTHSRLSVMPVTAAQFKRVLKLGT